MVFIRSERSGRFKGSVDVIDILTYRKDVEDLKKKKVKGLYSNVNGQGTKHYTTKRVKKKKGQRY